MDPVVLGIAIVLILIALAAKRYGLIPPGSARVLIQIAGGTVRVKRGVISPDAREHLQTLAEQFRIRRAAIGLTSRRKVLFSGSVPGAARQAIRNVLLNL